MYNRTPLPENLFSLHQSEEQLRLKALDVLAGHEDLRHHVEVVELAMDVADVLRQFDTQDEDTKLIQVLGIRTFNAFGAALKLALSGYSQNSALIMRDVLETAFLLDLFGHDRALIPQWRMADKAARLKEFAPVKVRTKLDDRDGFTTRKRAAMYDLFSELAGHPTMQAIAMLRPMGMDAQIGPFVDPTALRAVVSEMGRLAIQVGGHLCVFFPAHWLIGRPMQKRFEAARLRWFKAMGYIEP